MRNLIFSLMLVSTLALGNYSNHELYEKYPTIYGDGVYSVAQETKARGRAKRLQREIAEGGLYKLAQRTEQALERIIEVANINLRRKGFHVTADNIEADYKIHKGSIIAMTLLGRDIGDFEPWSDFIRRTYMAVEARLGLELCRALRISDLHTINQSRVVFQPCRYGLYEFELHFIHDSKYRGLIPVVAYWVTSIGCSLFTAGMGTFIICSPLAMLVEWSVDSYVAPWLAPKIYGWACD